MNLFLANFVIFNVQPRLTVVLPPHLPLRRSEMATLEEAQLVLTSTATSVPASRDYIIYLPFVYR